MQRSVEWHPAWPVDVGATRTATLAASTESRCVEMLAVHDQLLTDERP